QRQHGRAVPGPPHARGAGGTAGMDGRPAAGLDDRDPLDVARLRERLHAALDEFCARQARALARVSPECAPLVETVAALIRGGKRLRPAFCYWGWRGAGGGDVPAAVAAAPAPALFQGAALMPIPL